MADRTAIDTIKGYFYQFDYAIAKLLESANDEDKIVVEGVEDVDIKTATEDTAIQCKYYAKTEYNHSVIAKPIRLMLNHFKDVKEMKKPSVNYHLYGYFQSGQDKLSLPVDVIFLKENFLTYTKEKAKHKHHLELGLDDSDLTDFLSKLKIDINALEYQAQLNKILNLLMVKFDCKNFEAELFYYNNALKFIKDVSVQGDIANREITKSDFLNKINTKKILFNEWYIQIKGEKSYYASLRKEYFGDFNTLYKERFFLFEIDENNYSRSDVKQILNLLIKKYTKIINQPKPFCPYVYFYGMESAELIELKTDLIADDILLIDGFDFKGAKFNPDSLCQHPNISHPIKIKFINEFEFLESLLAITNRKSEIYQFYIGNEIFNSSNHSIKNVKIQVKQLNNIKEII